VEIGNNLNLNVRGTSSGAGATTQFPPHYVAETYVLQSNIKFRALCSLRGCINLVSSLIAAFAVGTELCEPYGDAGTYTSTVEIAGARSERQDRCGNVCYIPFVGLMIHFCRMMSCVGIPRYEPERQIWDDILDHSPLDPPQLSYSFVS
jgi:hypothetical protein